MGVYLGVFAGDPPVGGWGGSCFGDPPVGGFGREPPVGGCILEGLCVGGWEHLPEFERWLGGSHL